MTSISTIGALLLIAGTAVVVVQTITTAGAPSRVGLTLVVFGVAALLLDALADSVRGDVP